MAKQHSDNNDAKNILSSNFYQKFSDKYYNIKGDQYDPNLPPSLYLIDTVLNGGQKIN